jgi:peptide/nickel transport system permease protein
VLRIREEQFVPAAVNVGTTHLGIMFRHVLPNLLAPVLVTATMQIGYMVILESGLSFFGITGSSLSWGWDISAGRKYLGTAWWIASFPGFAIFFTVLSFNMIGDFLRDVIDPHNRYTPAG